MLLGHNNNLSSDLRSWQKSFQDNSFSGAASGKQKGDVEGSEVCAGAWAWARDEQKDYLLNIL